MAPMAPWWWWPLWWLAGGAAEEWSVWPRPQLMRRRDESTTVPLGDDFRVRFAQAPGAIGRKAARRCERALATRPRHGSMATALRHVVAEVVGPPDRAERLDAVTDFSYNVTVRSTGPHTVARISAASVFGLIYGAEEPPRGADDVSALQLGLETWTQLSWRNRAVPGDLEIVDFASHGYRGVLVDVARHFLPLPVLRRLVDGAAASKLNVVHLHLTDSQSFPAVFEEEALKVLGVAGAFDYPSQTYSEADLRGLVTYARLRGVRLVPEVDTPAHTLAWGRAYPELVVNCSDVALAGGASATDVPALDPTKERTYEVVEAVLRAVARIFPDELLHIGADEVRRECWARLQPGGGAAAVEDYKNAYVARVASFVARDLKKRPVVWQDALEGPVSLSSDRLLDALRASRAVVETWKCWSNLAPKVGSFARRAGLDVIDASCRYLDWPSPWRNYHVPSKVAGALGGEGAMWTEDVDLTSVECRTFPRAAAVADVLWGGGGSSSWGDVDDVEAALEIFTDKTLRERLAVKAARLHDATGGTGVAGRGFCPSFHRSAARKPVKPPASVGVAALNVDDGGHEDRGRMDLIAAWMRRENARGTVVLGLTELNGWDRVGDHGERLFDRLGADAGYAFSTLLPSRGQPYLVGVLSTQPIRLLAKFEPPAFERGALFVETGGLKVIVAHLDAHDAAKRLVEAETLAAAIRPHLDSALVLLGDLNTLSPLDAADHARPDGANAWLAAATGEPRMARMRRKYLDPNKTGRLAYGPMQALLDSGLVDTCDHLGCLYTEPTSLTPDQPELPPGVTQIPLRVDYILATPAFAAFHLDVHVHNNTETRWMSDHFPIAARWTPDPDGGGEPAAAQTTLTFWDSLRPQKHHDDDDDDNNGVGATTLDSEGERPTRIGDELLL